MMAILGIWIETLGGWQKRTGQVLLGFFLCLNLLTTLLYYQTPSFQREDWRSVVRQVESMAVGKKSLAFFAFPEPHAPWRWYASGSVPALVTNLIRIDSIEELDACCSKVFSYDQVFVFDYLRDLTDPFNRIDAWLTHNGYVGVHSIDGKEVGFVRVYQREVQ